MYFIKNYKFTLIVGIIILISILMPGRDIPSVEIPHIDKIVHCGMFGCLTLCFYGEHYYKYRKYPKEWLVIGVIAGYCALTEVLQKLASGRSCDPIDWLADVTGILLAVVVFHIGVNYYKNKTVK